MLKNQIQEFIIEGKKSSKRPVFGFEGDNLRLYLSWAFSKDYLMLSSDENGISGILIAYPIHESYNGDIKQLHPKDIDINDETSKDICVLDMLANSPVARASLVSQFKKRFWNWEKQNKYAIQHGMVKAISNKFIKHLTLNNK